MMNLYKNSMVTLSFESALLALKDVSFRSSSMLQTVHLDRWTLYCHSLQNKDDDELLVL